MKQKNYIMLAVFATAILFSIGVASAIGGCDLKASLVNQDPIHAVPGEYVRVVFQLTGLDNPACGDVTFKVMQDYPFSLDPGVDPAVTLRGVTYTSSYNSQATIPYDLRVDKDALDNNYTLRVFYGIGIANPSLIEGDFSISVENVKSDFDVFVQNYVPSTKTLTFDILNTGKNNVEALTIEIPGQSSFAVTGSTKSIVGSLDANQDSTFTFTGAPKKGDINMTIAYNDANGIRRTVTKSASFDPVYFPTTVASSGLSVWFYIVLIIVLVFVVRWAWRKFSKKKPSQR
jgi:hypothetical protein